ncbi:uncharacterized protein LOC143182785 [Calliopsis andreniformis]|uniref:uncharacterized protein LOC143182785 n=1 Tax=Calliopsis andreniformis TaxID=337506 RepID=UPI003FCEA028
MSQQSSGASSTLAGKSSATYKILQDDRVGRYMVANKELKAGEEIVTEMPFVVGPKAFTQPLCLSCYTPWPPTLDDKPLCSKCGWPVCSAECENQPQHKNYECEIFAQANEKFNVAAALQDPNENGVPQLECITPLRLLLESERNPERYNAEVKDMEAHNKIRCKKEHWKSDQVNIVEYLRNRLKFERFTEEQIQTACGILEINTFEVRTANGFSARALYPTVALMNHSCVSNTCHSISPTDFRIRLRTTVDIPSGGELYGSYTHSLYPTMLRREHLLEGKHFACACPRCSDPTELGTHMSSLKCNKCDNGIILSLDSLDPDSSWKCTHCEFTTSGQAVRKVLRIIQADVDAVEAISGADGADAILERETVMKKYHSVLHPRHAFNTMIRHSLTQMYGRVDEYLLDDLPDVVLEHKIDMCKLLLQVLDVVEPGYSRIRGMTLYELHAPLLFIAKTQWNAGVIDEAALKSKMIEASEILKESATILCLEPPDTPEGQIGIVAKESLVQLEQSINNRFAEEKEVVKVVSRIGRMTTEEKSKSATPTLKYKLTRSEKLGRYLQAAKNLGAGEVILREKPVTVGPFTSSTDYVCFACLRLLPKIKKGTQYVCSKCNVALLCGTACENEPKYHTSEECSLLKSNNELSADNIMDLIGVLLPLRLWLLKQTNSEVWKQIESMESHVDKRRNTSVWRDRETNVINVMKALCLVPKSDPSTSELLQQLCGILDVNTFELRSPGGLDGLLLRGLYAEASLMAHDCRGNTHLTVDDNFHLTVYASLPIEAGEPILFNYTSSLLGTSGRREHLREGKYFDCECPLCKDPYEMGSYMSSILCPRCREGYIGIQNPLTVTPYERGIRWQCNKCKSNIAGRLVRATLDITRMLIDSTDDSDIKGLETLTTKLLRSLHPNHFLMLSLKQKLLAAYRKEVASPNPQKKIMQRMLDACKEMYDVLEIVEPGISRLKGIMLYEMHLPMVLLANRAYAAREISSTELASRLEEAGSLLKRSLRMLLLEPADTPEGKLAKRALQELKGLNQNIADVKTISTVEETHTHKKRKSQKKNPNKNK